jgi:hypothetical protein
VPVDSVDSVVTVAVVDSEPVDSITVEAGSPASKPVASPSIVAVEASLVAEVAGISKKSSRYKGTLSQFIFLVRFNPRAQDLEVLALEMEGIPLSLPPT